MKKNLTSLLGAFFALALVATACGGSDSSASSPADQELISAIADEMAAEGDVPEDFDVNCMAAAMVTGLGGAEKIEAEYGLTAAAVRDGADPNDVELPRDEAISLADGFIDCGLTDLMVQGMTEDGALSEDDAKCLVSELDSDLFRDMFAAEFMIEADAAAFEADSFEALLSSMIDAVGECDLDPSVLGF